MLIQILKSKIHRVKITQADLNYIGSITIDPLLMKAANIMAGEKVQVLNISNGERLETYVIEGQKEGEICIFPAFFEHWVEENKSNEDRISVSFNVELIPPPYSD